MPLQAQDVWVTQADHEFGDAPEEDVTFSWPSIVVDPDRNRILAMDGFRVSAWTPTGSLLFAVGQRGEGPGEFRTPPGNLFVEPNGDFSVQEGNQSRYTYFSASGELLRTVQGPAPRLSYQGLGVTLHYPDRDGTYLGTPQVPMAVEVGGDGRAPMERQPILRVAESGSDEWDGPDPVFWLDRGNRTLVMQLPGGGEMFGAQPFGDPDQVAFEPGRAVVVSQKGEPGEVELIEFGATGDTVWHRRLEFEPRRLTRQMVDAAAGAMVDVLNQSAPETPRARLRQAFDEGLYRPAFAPPIEGPPILTSTGEVWLRSTELSDTLRAYTVIARGDLSSEPRRVLLPEGMWVHDATETHVWGVSLGVADVPRIVGRRLLRLQN